MAARHLRKLQLVALSVSRGRRRRNGLRGKWNGPRNALPRSLRRNRPNWHRDATPWGRGLGFRTFYFPDDERARRLSRHGTQLPRGGSGSALLGQRGHLGG